MSKYPLMPLRLIAEPRRERLSPAASPDLPYIGMECIEPHTRRVLRFERSADYKSTGFRFLPGDVLYGRLRPYLNKVWRADREGICSGEFIVIPKSPQVETSYLAYGLSSTSFVSFANDLNRGDRPRVTFEQIARYEIPVAPVQEQGRIAAELDWINERITEVEYRLSAIPLILKRFRMSVLMAAMSGALTKGWRCANDRRTGTRTLLETIKRRRLEGARTRTQRESIDTQFAHLEKRDGNQLPATWQFLVLGKLATFTYGTSQKSRAHGKVPVLRMGNLQNGEIDWSDLAFTSDRTEIEKYNLHPMTVLFNRTNSPELVGKTAIYRGERPAIFAGYLIRINHEQELLPEYLNYCLNSIDARAWCRVVKTDGVSQSNINAQKLAKYEIPFCPVQEQREIVRKVSILFQRADAIEAQYRKALAYTNNLMPAAIEKAYRGELFVAPGILRSLEREVK